MMRSKASSNWALCLPIFLLILLLTTSLLPGAVYSAEEKSEMVLIIRDQYGVPHIHANSVEGLFYGFGYSTAQDRLFQLEMNMRTVQGRVSEILGPAYLAYDNATRRDTYTREELTRMVTLLDKEHQAMLEHMPSE